MGYDSYLVQHNMDDMKSSLLQDTFNLYEIDGRIKETCMNHKTIYARPIMCIHKIEHSIKTKKLFENESVAHE